MTMLDELKESFSYTKYLFQRPRELLTLILISIIPLLDFITVGFLGKILKDDLTSKSVPKFEKFGELFIFGLKIMVLVVVWLVVIFILTSIVGLEPFSALMVLLLSPGTRRYYMLPLIGFLVVVFIFGLFALMSIVNMVKQGSFMKAFDLQGILNRIQNIGWPKYIAFVLCYFIVALIEALIVGSIMGFVSIRGHYGLYLELLLCVVLMSILFVLPAIIFTRTIGVLYDKAAAKSAAQIPPPPPPPA